MFLIIPPTFTRSVDIRVLNRGAVSVLLAGFALVLRAETRLANAHAIRILAPAKKMTVIIDN